MEEVVEDSMSNIIRYFRRISFCYKYEPIFFIAVNTIKQFLKATSTSHRNSDRY